MILPNPNDPGRYGRGVPVPRRVNYLAQADGAPWGPGVPVVKTKEDPGSTGTEMHGPGATGLVLGSICVR